ncbi:MAG TPA: GFA family protein [Polyangiaceae bacterium]|nr:GFA family protein [Polyangiaceae bacterium]
MTQSAKHQGGCHCGAVRFEVEIDPMEPAVTCNCSICSKTGTMLNFVSADDFALLAGQDMLTDYQFNKKQLHHWFCSRCGVRSFAGGVGPTGKEMRAINVRCLDGIDVDAVPTRRWNGKDS